MAEVGPHATGRAARASAFLVLVMLGACATDRQRTTTEGAALGAVLGAVLGHVIGGRDGAVAGAAIGGVAGGVHGSHVADKKQQYAEREDALRVAAAQSQAVAQEARSANEALQRDITALKALMARLQNETMTTHRRNELAQATRRSFDEANRKLDQQLAAVRGELVRQHEVIRREQALAQQTREGSSPSALRMVSAGVEDLQSHQRVLERAKAQLALLESRRAF